MEPVEPYKRLAQALEDRCRARRLTWNDAAKEIGISPEGLRKIRYGRGGPGEQTVWKLEDWLGWKPGSVKAVWAGKEPTPLEATGGQDLKELAEDLREQAARLQARLDDATAAGDPEHLRRLDLAFDLAEPRGLPNGDRTFSRRS